MPSSKACSRASSKRVPAHMRDLEGRIAGLDRPHLAFDPAEARRHAHARARARPSAEARRRCRETACRAACTASSSASIMPGMAASPCLQSAKAPTPGSTMRSAAAHVLRVGSHLDGERRAAFPRRALEGLGGGVEVARTVIDDGDVHVGSSLREEPDDLLRPRRADRWRRLPARGGLAAARGRPSGARSAAAARREERRSASIAVAPARHAREPVAAPFERGRAEIVGLEGEQHADREARPAEQRLALRHSVPNAERRAR